jgi:hypothetical protein
MDAEQLKQVRKELKGALGYSMDNWLFSAINDALVSESAVKPLFDDYYDSSLKYFGVKPLPQV